MSNRTMEIPRRNSRDTVANITTCEPCNVSRTLPRVAGGQSIVDKAQKHNIFVKVSALLHVRQAQLFLLTSHTYVGCHFALYLEQTCWSGQEHSMKSPAHKQKHLGAMELIPHSSARANPLNLRL